MQKSKKSKLKITLLAIFIFIAVLIFSVLAFISISYITTPLDKSRLASTNLGVEIYDTTTHTTPVYYSSDKKIISSSQLQPHTLNAFIAIEDKRFYEHNGYDLKRIAKATLVNLKSGSKSQGASTITQQLVKNILLNSEKTYSRKFKEIMLAIKTEKNFTKEEILNMYLNSIYFGSNAYGIESASNLYFDKSASELDINQSAILAGIIKSPVYYSPINYPDNCFKRKNIVLEQMYVNGYITKDEYEVNKLKPVEVNFKKNNYDNSYNQQAIIEACELLNISEKELLRQELKIYTYLDNNIQQSVEQALSNTDFKEDKLSMVADNNGHILAYCGDSYFDLSQMKRNPAST
ncbi:MAG: transglycosylase domain-containing protein, partial [Clostridia bacterium]|nr:transglycosylase domain-containing protein [Clostridia bacterium]